MRGWLCQAQIQDDEDMVSEIFILILFNYVPVIYILGREKFSKDREKMCPFALSGVFGSIWRAVSLNSSRLHVASELWQFNRM